MRIPVFALALVLFPLAFAALAPSPVFAEDMAKAHVAVVSIANQTNSPSYDAACKAATDTLSMTLSQLGRYAVQPMDSIDGREDALRTAAVEQNLDFIMYGRMSKGDSGGIAFSLSVFDRAKGKTTLSQSRKAGGVLDIFEVTDDLIVAVLESMTGSHIGFGSATLANKGEAGRYTVLVDGRAVGDDLKSLDRILIGKHRVTVVQRRMLGEREIAKAEVEVKEGETLEVGFAVPLLMDDEKAKLEALEASIQAAWNTQGKAAEVDGELAQLSSLLTDLSYSPRLSERKDAAIQLNGDWALHKCRVGIEASAWRPAIDLLDAGWTIYQNAKSYPDPSKIEKAFEEDAQLVETLFELAAGKALSDGDQAKAQEYFGDALMVSTRFLKGSRMKDYAYAMTLLQQAQGGASAQAAAGLKSVFGPWMAAGRRFYALQGATQASARILVASDLARQVGVNGAEAADSPLALQPAKPDTTFMVQARGDEKAVQLYAAAGQSLAFLADGFASFGELAIGAAAAPGAIEVTYSFDSALGPMSAGPQVMASLDGADPVVLPHVFENVPAGPHQVTMPNVWWKWKLYKGPDAAVAVEPGKRAKYDGRLTNGKGTLEIRSIPKGSTVQMDGDEISDFFEGPDGGLWYRGVVLAGDSNLEIADGNKLWKGPVVIPVDGTSSLSIRDLHQYTILQSKAVKLSGKDADWDGVSPVFAGSGYNNTPQIAGSEIAGGSLCRDDNNITIRMDFADGQPNFAKGSDRQLELFQGNQQVNLEVNVGSDGTIHPDIWVRSLRKSFPAGSMAAGKTFLEMQFRLSDFTRYLDFSQPISCDLDFFVSPDWGMTHNQTRRVDILIKD
jgi:hypothetical protein